MLKLTDNKIIFVSKLLAIKLLSSIIRKPSCSAIFLINSGNKWAIIVRPASIEFSLLSFLLI